jgi:hypothetical protein
MADVPVELGERSVSGGSDLLAGRVDHDAEIADERLHVDVV